MAEEIAMIDFREVIEEGGQNPLKSISWSNTFLSIRRNRLPKRLIWLGIVFGLAMLYTFAGTIKTAFCNSELLFTDINLVAAQKYICPPNTITAATPEWDLKYHQGGNGPWIPKIDGVLNDDLNLPKGCVVDQVHMLVRHAERYPTTNAGKRHITLLNRLKNWGSVGKSLSFIKTWSYITDPDNPDFENLIINGPYSGTKQAHHTGEILRSRYGHLIHPSRPTKFWSCTSPRDVDTALYFAGGFFGPTWESDGIAKLEKIDEMHSRGADTLTPGRTCTKNMADQLLGRQRGYRNLEEWQKTFTEPIIRKLDDSAPGFRFSHRDIYSMMEMCGFEILVRGDSPWCNIFMKEEWLDFEYGRDLLHYYRSGPGNPYAASMGGLWLNATLTNLLNNSESASSAYFSFVHDGDILPVIATLGLLDEYSAERFQLPKRARKDNRQWRTSDIVPMGGRIVLERIRCSSDKTWVRLFINDGHLSLVPSVDSGKFPHDMKMTDFTKLVQEKVNKAGKFMDKCGLDQEGPDRISFLYQ